ncbi:MAG: tetratricopeptide repeat-containing sulfotransferase family protein [Woeseiaceae bacterium]
MDLKQSKPLLADIEKAIAAMRAGRRPDAVLTYEAISERDDLDAIVHAALGRLCLALDGTFLAVQHFQKAVEDEPDNAENQAYLGIALQAERRSNEAAIAFEKALEIEENMPACLNGLGVIQTNRGDFEKANELFEKAEKLKPSDGVIQTNYAMALTHLNEHEAALKHAEKALKLVPDNSNAHYAYGAILSQSGRVDDAVKHFEGTIRKNPMFGGAYDHLARIKRFSKDDKPFIDKVEKILKKGMPARERVCIHYALGKMYDNCEMYDEAFENYRQANLLKKKKFDRRPADKRFQKVRKAIDAKTLKKYQQHGNDSIMPIFVLGMPRSGTTLMERMITSSDRVAGAGELTEIPHIASEVLRSDKNRPYAALIQENLDADGIATYSEQYLKILRQADQNAERIVDKLPSNYMHVWAISILFPKATIIFARRHPLDIALSCFFQNFSGIPWSVDLETIADEYRFHRQTMDYWKKILPEGKILDVHYEQLVAEPEIYGRRMLEGCGLEWSGDGLDHYKKDKVVKTASLWQVRQPVYQSSRMRWKKYAPHLGELANLMSEFLQDDREELGEHGIELSAPSGISRLKKIFG